jgi:predicted DNA-binding transcriptional regulator YafY
MAWDVERTDWRTFRLDRMREPVATDWRFRPREHPDPAGYVQRSVAEAPYRHVARLRVNASPQRVRDMVPPQVGRVEPDPADGWCTLFLAADHLDWLAVYVARLGVDVQILDPPALREAVAALAGRLAAIAGPATPPPG